jgi:hypothetical protein
MKFRTDGSSVRLRLRRSEVRQLAEQGLVEARLRFGPRELAFSLELDQSLVDTQAEFDGASLRVLLPYRQGLEWCESAEIAIRNETSSPPVLVEKDFVRTAVIELDDYDRFENPRSGRKPPPAPESPANSPISRRLDSV